MNSKIDRLAEDFARIQTPDQSDEFWYETRFHQNEDKFREVAGHFYTLPLADRLTDDEKERVCDEYDEARIYCENLDPCCEEWVSFNSRKNLLERIYGRDFFNAR